MTPDLKNLLTDAAEASPDLDLAPAALRGAKRRRTASGIAAVALTVPMLALIAGLVVTQQPAASPTPQPQPLAPVSTTQKPTPTTVFTTVSTPAPLQGMYEIPAGIGLTNAEAKKWLPTITTDVSGMSYPRVAPVWGMMCNRLTSPDPISPVSGRSWTWYAESKGGLDSGQLDIIVTGWADGQVALSAIKDNDGTKRDCFIDGYKLRSSSPTSLDLSGIYVGPDGPTYVASVRRVNNVLVSVTYIAKSTENASSYASTVGQIADRVAKNAVAAGLDQK